MQRHNTKTPPKYSITQTCEVLNAVYQKYIETEHMHEIIETTIVRYFVHIYMP